MKNATRCTRRAFLRRAAGAAAVAGIASAPAIRAAGPDPSSTLRLGLIGCGGRGRELLKAFDFADVKFPAVCDVNAPRMDEARKVLDRDRKEAAEPIADHRRLLQRKDIDGVVIATCEHWHGILFIGNRAALVLDREGYEIHERSSPGKPVAAEGKSAQDGPWQRHFADCVKGSAAPAVSLEESHRATVCCLLGNIAYHTRRRIPWDAEWETIPGDDEARAMLSRPRRQGYELVSS